MENKRDPQRSHVPVTETQRGKAVTLGLHPVSILQRGARGKSEVWLGIRVDFTIWGHKSEGQCPTGLAWLLRPEVLFSLLPLFCKYSRSQRNHRGKQRRHESITW